MKSKFFYPLFAAALLSMASACSPKAGSTTRIVGQFAENAPETVTFTRGYFDGMSEEVKFVSFYEKTVKVVNGRFETEIPKYLATETEFRVGDNTIRRLRSSLSDAAGQVKTMIGRGYRITEE